MLSNRLLMRKGRIEVTELYPTPYFLVYEQTLQQNIQDILIRVDIVSIVHGLAGVIAAEERVDTG